MFARVTVTASELGASRRFYAFLRDRDGNLVEGRETA
jgi:hypothetical protein